MTSVRITGFRNSAIAADQQVDEEWERPGSHVFHDVDILDDRTERGTKTGAGAAGRGALM